MSSVKFDFTDETFIVTGASSGMGKQVALDLTNAGAKVLAIARSKDKLDELKQLCPDRIITAPLDVCDSGAVDNSIASFVKEHGKLNGVVHAAGIMGLTPLKAYDEKEACKIMETSFWAGAKLIQASTKRKHCLDGTSVIWFSSERARAAASGLFAYSGAKAAVQVAAKTFAKELALRKIRVNTISPGWVHTNMTDGLEDIHNMEEISASSLFGFGEPADVSGMVLYLLSDKAKWITGADIPVSGGFGI